MKQIILILGICLGFEAEVFANKTSYLPGDALFYVGVENSEWKIINNNKSSALEYDRPEILPSMLCGYAGYQKRDASNRSKQSHQEPAQPLSEIFDGKSLDNWSLENGKPVPSGWEVNDGTIHRKPGKKRIGNIITREQYGDFELSFEWKIAKGGNSGIKYRVRKYGRKMLGYEYQIYDSGKTDQPPSKKDTGSIYALSQPSPDRTLNPDGQFNTSRIVARGNRIDHWLNGQLIASASIGNAEWEKRVAESKFNDVPDFGRNARGRIMLTDHGAEVWYRNLKISSPPEPSGSNTVMPK